MTKIIAVVGSKGGIGKTTTLKNIAALRASAGKSSIVVDVDDRQHSFDIWYKRREDFGMANYIDYNGIYLDKNYSLDKYNICEESTITINKKVKGGKTNFIKFVKKHWILSIFILIIVFLPCFLLPAG